MYKPLRSQRGYTLLELGVVIAVGTLLAGMTLWSDLTKLRQSKASAQGTQLANASNAVATYMTTYYSQLVNNQAISGYGNIYAPTIAELRTAQLLPANFSSTNLYGGGYVVAISRVPAGCTPPNCDIVSMTNLTGPITNPMTGRPDGPALGTAASVLGTDGGYSTLASPGTITGQGGAWSVTNPAGNIAGILGMRAGYGSSGWAQFLRRDGQLPMTGALDMGNQNVNNANILNSSRISNSGNATIGGTLGVTGQTSTNGITNSGSLTTGNATISGSATITGNTSMGGTLNVSGQTTTAGIQNNGNLSSTGDTTTNRLSLQAVVASGTSCSGFDGYQAKTAAGSIASCINGTWSTPSASVQPPSPCSGASVSFGAGCTGNLSSAMSGSSQNVTMTSGSGFATYSCNNGSWSFMSGSCTPPPANCPATSVSFGSGCQGNLPQRTSGSSANVSMTVGSGNATYSCNNGSWSFVSGSCTPPPSGCAATTLSWSVSASCSGQSTSMSHGGSQTVNSTNGNVGSVSATCSNGSVIQSSPSCSKQKFVYTNPVSTGGQRLAANPNLRSQYCFNRGKVVSGTGQVEVNMGGSNINFCHTINGSGACVPGASGNCTGFTSGCWIQTQITCENP